MQHRERAIWILISLTFGFTVISYNLIQIQLVQHDKYRRMAILNHLHPEKIEPKRGSIFDSDGQLLAETQTRTDVHLDGKLLTNPDEQLPILAGLLQVPEAQLQAEYDPRKRDIPVAEDLDDDTVAKLMALSQQDEQATAEQKAKAPNWNCLIFKPHDRRFYPNNDLAAHVLGYMDGQGQGAMGVEKELDKQLSGAPGERWVERDGKGKEVAGYQTEEKPATDGCDVTLTIKAAIQHLVEDELDGIVQNYQPNAAYIIVMDPHTGEILAMGSRPTFDPNDSRTFQAENVRNRCLTDPVEPGSIFKIITMAAALNERKIDLRTPIFCENGEFTYGGKKLHDDEPNGWLPALEVMAQSSNIGFAKIALNYLHEEKLYQYATAFGIGQRTGLFERQGESPGLLEPLNQWSALSITRIPMGQEVEATPLQMATAMCVVANGGRLMVPQVLKQVTDASGHMAKVYQPRMVRQVISPEAAQEVARALEQVTIDGTAKNVHIEDASGARWSFAGKTGTAQKVVDGEYSHTKFVSSFLGFLPAEDPAFVALVMVDEPKTTKFYGAEVSAPVFASLGKQIAQMMNLPPDIPAPSSPVLTSYRPQAL